jgi:hypothetical protein
VERLESHGVWVFDSIVAVESTIIRDVAGGDLAEGGLGIGFMPSDTEHGRPSATLRGSIVERVGDIGIYVEGSDLTVEATAVRQVAADDSGMFGRGLDAEKDWETNDPSQLTIRGSLFEETQEFGVFALASELDLSSTLVRDVAPNGNGHCGRCVQLQSDAEATATGRVRDSVFERCIEVGLMGIGTQLSVDAAVIRDIATNGAGSLGDGIVAFTDPVAPTTLDLVASTVANMPRAGVASFGARVTLERTRLECNAIQLDGEAEYSLRGAPVSQPFLFEDLGGNRCGCGEQRGECAVLSSHLEPPEPADEMPPPTE